MSLTVPLYVTICATDGSETWQLIAGFCSEEWGPFDGPSDIVSAVQASLGLVWKPVSPERAREMHLMASEAHSDDPWEQLPLWR